MCWARWDNFCTVIGVLRHFTRRATIKGEWKPSRFPSAYKNSDLHAGKVLGKHQKTQRNQQKIINSCPVHVCWWALEGFCNIPCFFQRKERLEISFWYSEITMPIQQLGLDKKTWGISRLEREVVRVTDSRHSQAGRQAGRPQTRQLWNPWHFQKLPPFHRYWWDGEQRASLSSPGSGWVSLALSGFAGDTPAWQSEGRAARVPHKARFIWIEMSSVPQIMGYYCTPRISIHPQPMWLRLQPSQFELIFQVWLRETMHQMF